MKHEIKKNYTPIAQMTPDASFGPVFINAGLHNPSRACKSPKSTKYSS